MAADPTVVEFGPQKGPQWEFLASDADITIYGGARGGGKTYGLCLSPLRHVKDAMFRGVIFRRTYPQIYQDGGIWDTALKLYPYAGASSTSSTWGFPSGATVSFHHMANDDDWQNWMGSQVPYIGFDQLEQFTEKQFFNMMACNRDPNGIVQPYIQATCNPEPSCWLSRFIQWWWDKETGYPVLSRSGTKRWFIRVGDVLKWGDDHAKLEKGAPKGTRAKSVCFIAAFVEDNVALLQSDPDYLATLLSQPLVERERWHKGNWKITATAGTIFNRIWFKDKIVAEVPLGNQAACRYWDLAHTPEGEGHDPDYTASVKMHQIMGNTYVTGFTRWRRSSYETEQSIKATAQADGIECKQAMEQEPSAGKSYCAHYQRNVLQGFTFEPIPSIKSKLVRAGPLSTAVQAGSVYLVAGPWNAEFIDYLEAFRGDEEKNDVPDAASGCYNALMSGGGANAGAVEQGHADRLGNLRINRRVMF